MKNWVFHSLKISPLKYLIDYTEKKITLQWRELIDHLSQVIRVNITRFRQIEIMGHLTGSRKVTTSLL